MDAITVTIHRKIDEIISQFGKQITQKIDMLNQYQTKINQKVKALDYQIGTIEQTSKRIWNTPEIKDYDSNSLKITPEHNDDKNSITWSTRNILGNVY